NHTTWRECRHIMAKEPTTSNTDPLAVMVECRITCASVRGIEIASTSPSEVLNSTTQVPSSFGPKIMMRFSPFIAAVLGRLSYRGSVDGSFRAHAVFPPAPAALPQGCP